MTTTRTPTWEDLHNESTWLEYRALAEASPAIRWTDMATTDQTRAEFLEGVRLLRLYDKVRAGDGGCGPTPIQLAIADVINAGRFLNGVFEPRRTTKTTSVQALMLGRCVMRDDYQAGWTMMTTGMKVSERFKLDMVRPIERLYPDPKQRPLKIELGKGYEGISWKNGSRLGVYTPNGDGFRSGGFDFALIDEAGEAEPEDGADITVSVLPTMDTKIGAQVVNAGTGGKYRAGNLLWDTVTDPNAGVIWHGIPETTDPEELDAWEPSPEAPRARMRELIEIAHPGVGWTTPVDAVERNFDKFDRDKFLREYGGQFGLEGAADTVIGADLWARAAAPALAKPQHWPTGATAALKVHHAPGGPFAALMVAWEQQEDNLDLVDAALVADGLAPSTGRKLAVTVAIHHVTTKTQRLQAFANEVTKFLALNSTINIVYDAYGNTEAFVMRLLKERPALRRRFRPTQPKEIPLAASTMLQLLDEGDLLHFRDAPLDEAAAVAVKRAFGRGSSFMFAAPTRDPDANLTPLEAAGLAILELKPTEAPVKPSEVFQF